jgi:hypothetical protein
LQLLMILLFVALMSINPAYLSESEPHYSPELIQTLKTIQSQTSQIRQLSIEENNWGVFLSQEDIIEQLQYENDNYLNHTNAYLNPFYQSFDFILHPIDIQTLLLEHNIANMDGYYDLTSKQFFIVMDEGDTPNDTLSPHEQATYAHEFTHTLQAQHFDIASLFPVISRDTSRALRAFIEGDARFVEQLFIEQSNFSHPDQLLTFKPFNDDPTTPPIFTREFEFIYLEGQSFIQYLYDKGGWEQVNAVYQSPPQYTHAILYPEGYLAGQVPVYVPIRSALVAFSDPLDWIDIESDVLGAFYLREYLATQFSYADILPILAHWNGDRYQIYQKVGSDTVAWVLNVAWTTPEHAKQFFDFYQIFAQSRTHQPFPAEIGGTNCWADGTLAICARFNGDGLITIANAPTVEEAYRMIYLQSFH